MSFNFPRTLCKISSLPASSSSTIDFTSAINSTFSTYVVKMRNIVSATNNVTFQLLFSTDNGSTWVATNYGWSNTFLSSGNSFLTNGNAGTDTSITIIGAISSTTSRALNGDLTFYDLNSGSLQPRQNGFLVYTNAVPQTLNVLTMGMNTGTTAVNALRFQMSSGAIASGTFTLYGVSEP